MSYIIRNYGNTRSIPFKNGSISMQRDGAIKTDDLEMVNALSGHPGISIVKQPGTIDVPPPAPAPAPAPAPEPEGPIDYTKLLKAELLALIEERGIDAPSGATKAVLIDLLIDWDERQGDEEEEEEEDEDEEDEEDEEE